MGQSEVLPAQVGEDLGFVADKTVNQRPLPRNAVDPESNLDDPGVIVTLQHDGRVSVHGISGDYEQENTVNVAWKSRKRIDGILAPLAHTFVALPVHKCVHIYDFFENRCVESLSSPKIQLVHPTFLKSHSLLAACGPSKSRFTIPLWRLRFGEKAQFVTTLSGHRGYVSCLDSRDDVWPNRLVSGAADRRLRIWDVTTCKETDLFQLSGWAIGVSVSPLGDYVSVASGSVVQVWDQRDFSGSPAHVLRSGRMNSVCCSPRNHLIVCNSWKQVFVYDLRNMEYGEALRKWDVRRGYCRRVHCLGNDNIVICGSECCRVVDYNGQTWKFWDGDFSSVCHVSDFNVDKALGNLPERLSFVVEFPSKHGRVSIELVGGEIVGWKALLWEVWK